MDSDKKKNITRKKFVKDVAATALYCTCFPLGVLADPARTSKTNKEERHKIKLTGTDKAHLVAACGTYCGACPAYLAKHDDEEHIKMRREKRHSSKTAKALKGIPPSNWMDGLLCDGCLSGGKLAAHCQVCNIRLHAEKNQNNSRCSHCEEFPCSRINNLINIGHYLHREEYLPNLKKIREMGVLEWVNYEEERWCCPKCTIPMSWYDAECVGCGEPRSKRLFSLTKSEDDEE